MSEVADHPSMYPSDTSEIISDNLDPLTPGFQTMFPLYMRDLIHLRIISDMSFQTDV